MRKAHKRRGLGVTLILAAAAALAFGLAIANPLAAKATPLSNATANCTVSAAQVVSAGRNSHLGGIVIAQEGSNCSTANGNGHKPTEPPFNGDPPLLFNGAGGAADCQFSPCEDGNVMMTASTGPLVIVPIFWNPTGYPMSSAYKGLITSYLAGVAKDSGHTKNVFSVLNEYHGNNGQIQYNVQLGPVINDTDPLPISGCTLDPSDTTGIYADGSGYSACLDDLQLQAEVDTVSAASSLPHNLSHIYVLYLPKAVESCFLPGETTMVGPPPGQFCTINHQPTAAFCAYHSEDPTRAVYADLAYPIYQSPVGFTCGSDALEAGFGVVESPNGNPDADVEISPTSHEISEAITDPDTETGWYDAGFNEIGDDCAYIYGKARGAKGAYFNQVINGGHFLTQQEFSNNLFASSGGTAGCLQSEG